jgi:hypothetical protein
MDELRADKARSDVDVEWRPKEKKKKRYVLLIAQ